MESFLAASVLIWPIEGPDSRVSAEEPLALFVDELASLGDRGLYRGLLAGEAVGADEGMLLATFAARPRDRSCELVLAVFKERPGGDQVALVLDLLGCGGGIAVTRLSPAEQAFQERHPTRPFAGQKEQVQYP